MTDALLNVVCDNGNERGRTVLKHRPAADRSTLVRRRPAMAERICSVDDCGRPAKNRRMCWAHYARLRKHGDVGVPELLKRTVFGPCSIDGCERDAKKRGWCDMHYERWRNAGDPLTVRKSPGGKRRQGWISYTAAHLRVKAERGRASQHQCSDCGTAAQEWAYNHAAPDEMTEDKAIRGRPITLTYSGNPSNYDPVCVPCHTRRDRWKGGRSN